MSDHFPIEPGQEDAALAHEIARLEELLQAEGRRWRRHDPSTARLENHVRTLARLDAAPSRTGGRMLTDRHQALDTSTQQSHPRRVAPRWRDPLAVVATLLLIVLASTVFAVTRSRNAGKGLHHTDHIAHVASTPSITRVTAIQPQNTLLPIPKNAYLSGISFSSAHDGWVAGGIRIPDLAGQDFSAQRGVLAHYHDGVWTAASETLPGLSLSSVSMVSGDEGWAVGMTINPPDNTGGVAVLLHYIGGHWVRVTTPALAGVSPQTIHMFSPDAGYIVGVVNVPSTIAAGTADAMLDIVVYQNGAWTATPTPFGAYTSQLVMVSASEGWANTFDGQATSGGVPNPQSTLYHYLHDVWTKSLTIPGYIISMSASSPSDVWALASECATCGEPAVRIERYDGATWEPVNLPGASDGMKIPAFGRDTIPDVTLYDGVASGVWMAYNAQDMTKPPSQRQQSMSMWVYGLWGNTTWLSAGQSIKDSMMVAMAGDGNGGMWALSQANSSDTVTVLYTQSNAWQVYGHS